MARMGRTMIADPRLDTMSLKVYEVPVVGSVNPVNAGGLISGRPAGTGPAQETFWGDYKVIIFIKRGLMAIKSMPGSSSLSRWASRLKCPQIFGLSAMWSNKNTHATRFLRQGEWRPWSVASVSRTLYSPMVMKGFWPCSSRAQPMIPVTITSVAFLVVDTNHKSLFTTLCSVDFFSSSFGPILMFTTNCNTTKKLQPLVINISMIIKLYAVSLLQKNLLNIRFYNYES